MLRVMCAAGTGPQHAQTVDKILWFIYIYCGYLFSTCIVIVEDGRLWGRSVWHQRDTAELASAPNHFPAHQKRKNLNLLSTAKPRLDKHAELYVCCVLV